MPDNQPRPSQVRREFGSGTGSLGSGGAFGAAGASGAAPAFRRPPAAPERAAGPTYEPPTGGSGGGKPLAVLAGLTVLGLIGFAGFKLMDTGDSIEQSAAATFETVPRTTEPLTISDPDAAVSGAGATTDEFTSSGAAGASDIKAGQTNAVNKSGGTKPTEAPAVTTAKATTTTAKAAATPTTAKAPATTTKPTATPGQIPSTTLMNGKQVAHFAAYHQGKLTLYGAVPEQKYADMFVKWGTDVLGPANVINNMEINPLAPVPNTGIVRVDEEMLFPIGTTEIGAQYQSIAALAVGVMNLYPEATMTFVGHTDDTGTVEANYALSLARAQAVVDYLVTLGKIDPARFKAEGRGPSEPRVPNDSDENRAKNRRIEVTIDGLFK